MDKGIEELIGKTIKNVYMNAQYLKFETDESDVIFTVEGDCCSTSSFYDFIGLDKLLKNGKVKQAGGVALEDDERSKVEGPEEETQCYGYEIVTEDPKFGDVTTVFSFRNYSNGYYGGWMYQTTKNDDTDKMVALTEDALEVKGW